MTRVHTPTPTVGDLIAGRKKGRHRRTYQPVRRNSFHKGEREKRFWQPVDPLVMRATIEAARMANLIGKQAGKRNGPLGHIALEVLEALTTIVSWKSGQLDPAIDWIARRIKRARSAVIRALKRLKDEGFLEWMRRSEPIEDAEGSGPRVRQISNAYRVTAPVSWAKRIAARVAQWRLRKRPQGSDSPPGVREVQDPGLAAALARLSASLEGNDASPPKGQNPVSGS